MTNGFLSAMRNRISTPEGKMDYNRGLFSRVAREYDIATRVMSLGRDAAWKRALVGALPPVREPRCVDLACGTGDVTRLLARRYPAGEIVGVDLSPEMLEVACARRGESGARFSRGDMCRLALPDGWADILTGSYAIRNAPRLGDVLGEVRRVLRPGGVAAFLDFRKSRRRVPATVQVALLRYWCGLCGILVHGAPEHSYIAESLAAFPDARTLRDEFTRHGFHLLTSRTFLFGMTEMVVLERLGSAVETPRPRRPCARPGGPSSGIRRPVSG